MKLKNFFWSQFGRGSIFRTLMMAGLIIVIVSMIGYFFVSYQEYVSREPVIGQSESQDTTQFADHSDVMDYDKIGVNADGLTVLSGTVVEVSTRENEPDLFWVGFSVPLKNDASKKIEAKEYKFFLDKKNVKGKFVEPKGGETAYMYFYGEPSEIEYVVAEKIEIMIQ